MIGSVAAWGKTHSISRQAAHARVNDHQIPKQADGQIDFEVADQIWKASVNPLQQQRGATQPSKDQNQPAQDRGQRPKAKKQKKDRAAKAKPAAPSRMGMAQILHEEARATKARLEAGKLDEKLTEISIVKADWCDIATLIRDGLMGLPAKICTHLPSEWRREVSAAIEEEVRGILVALHDEIQSDPRAA